MCGIAGVVARQDRYRTTRETLTAMSAAIAHRGPDGENFFFNHENLITPDRPQCAMAFRRLAIIDPDPRSMQPFTIGTKTIVFNGEIYNFRDLRKELTAARPDYAWRTIGDTEVLLMSYEVWAEACVEHLNGMFAFAVWDEADHSLYLARDRMGQKPLYYTIGDGFIAFASELGAIRCGSFWNEISSIDRSALTEYLAGGYIGGGRTIYQKVRKLQPSCWFKRTTGEYFDRSGTSGEEINAQRTCQLVRQAVERQLVSDVPLGVFLSGGVDSSIIAACARRHGDVETFSIGFDDPRYDETRYAKEVAEHLGTKHHVFHVRPDVSQILPILAQSFGEPFADSSALPTQYLAQQTRGYVTVALSGDGGDELFGGYDRYRALALTERIPETIRLRLTSLGNRLPASHPKSRRAKIRRLLQSIHLPAAQRYAAYTKLFDAETIDALSSNSLANFATESQFTVSRDVVQAAAATDRMYYLPDDLLTKVDRCSMLYGLEVRSPFLDHDLVRFAAGMTADQMIGGGPKRMLREAFAAELPASVFKRKKMGFAMPVGDWLRDELRAMLQDCLFATSSFARRHFSMNVVQQLVDEHQQRRVDHSQPLYALLMLELWWRIQ